MALFHIPNSAFGKARSARRILRKPVEASRMRAHPADAFCPEAPCPRATTQASRKCQSRHRRDPRQSRGFTLMKINSFYPPRSPPPREGRVREGVRRLPGSCLEISPFGLPDLWYISYAQFKPKGEFE